MQVRAYLKSLRASGAVVNTSIAIGCAEGILMSNLLACNGGHITLNKHWGKNILSRMGFVKRKGNTKAKISVENFEVVKAQFLIDNKKAVVEMDEIPNELIIMFLWGPGRWKKKEVRELSIASFLKLAIPTWLQYLPTVRIDCNPLM